MRIFRLAACLILLFHTAMWAQTPQYATRDWVSGQNFATRTWVGQQNYLTSSSLTPYATQQWVQQQNYATTAAVGDPTTAIHLHEDFIGAQNANPYGELGWYANGGGGSLQAWSNNNEAIVGDSNHHGIVDLVDGSTQNSWEYLALGYYNTMFAFHRVDQNAWTLQAAVKDNGSVPFYQHQSRFGWSNGAGSQNPAFGIYFEANDTSTSTPGNWQCVTIANSTATTHDSGVATSYALWQDLKITSDGAGTIKFYINGTQVCTNTTNIPGIPTTGFYGIVFENVNTGTSGQLGHFYIDFVDLLYTVSR